MTVAEGCEGTPRFAVAEQSHRDGKPMGASITSRSNSRSVRSGDVETLRLSRPVSLLLILALSLGLWTIIWAATASVASSLGAG